MRFFPVLVSLASLASVSLVAQVVPAAAPEPVKAAAPTSKKIRTVRLKMRDGLRFEPSRLEAKPGEPLVIEIENGDATDLAHNFLLLRPGTRETVIAAALALAEKGPAQEFIPASADIIVHSQVLAPDGAAKITLTVPSQPGIYPYVCTFPGHGMIMYGALYVGVTPPPLEKDPNIPPTAAQTTVAGAGKRPFAQRIFMPDAGPAAIAVALIGSQNICWDAGQCRLRYAWQGGFIDATENWAGNGMILPVVPTKPWWHAPKDGFPLRFGTADSAVPTTKFLGYAATPTGPIFHYRAGETEVLEQVVPAAGRPGIAVRLQILHAQGPVFYRAANDANSKWTSTVGTWKGDVLTLTPAQATDVTLMLTSALCTP